MMIHEITALAGKYRSRKRVGRGPGSGNGQTAGRGVKGAGSRSGNFRRYQFEGGQMPYFRRMPKFGFTNANFKTVFRVVNLGEIASHPNFVSGGVVDRKTLSEAGLVRDDGRDLKILGDMRSRDGAETELKVKLEVTANRVTDAARKRIEGAGGSVNETGTRRDRVRGVDRNSDDRTPKNLTKKLRRPSKDRELAAKAAGSKGKN